MLVHCALLLLFLNFVRTTEYVYYNKLLDNRVAEVNNRFTWWPSVHNAANLVKVRRQVEQADAANIQTEGGAENINLKNPSLPASPPGDSKDANQGTKSESKTELNSQNSSLAISAVNTTVPTVAPVSNTTATKTNSTSTEKPKEIDLNDPRVLMRSFIVFGGFALLAVAYFIFYRRNSKNGDLTKTHNTNDNNQFRYGVLQSEDRRDNLELSRVPLTMESDDDDDEDLEIFDLEQKKKSLSYVNLQTNDEDVVFPHKESGDNDRENLLLDIDSTSETLINWSNSGSKSIL